jgi:signal transduction histidine kinase
VEDITQRKVAESALQAKTDEMKMMTQQLWQTAKLATMGELAASIAHELNNPLAILSLRIESVLASLPPDSEAQPELEVMEREVDRMASLVTNLLQFSRSSNRQISSLQVEKEVDQTLELMQNYLVHRHVSVQREYTDQLPMILADRQQLRQLFLNLITNATDAMPAGGTLHIKIDAEQDRRHVKIEVRDTGVGIPPEHIRSVMEPFYTTKPEGKGTGLGLAICRRIIEEHNGSIHISSTGKDQGTTIQLILPSSSTAKTTFITE